MLWKRDQEQPPQSIPEMLREETPQSRLRSPQGARPRQKYRHGKYRLSSVSTAKTFRECNGDLSTLGGRCGFGNLSVTGIYRQLPLRGRPHLQRTTTVSANALERW